MRALKFDMGDRQWFVLYVVVCIEVGLFLTLVPWSAIWERNYFLEAYPALRAVLLAPAVRGAVAGLGVANIYMGLREVLTRRYPSVTGESSRPEEGGAGEAPIVDREIAQTEGEPIATVEEGN
jgi:hypothetical protein